MIMDKYLDYILEQMKTLLAIDSPSGYTQKVTDYLMAEYQRLGYHPLKTVKGGVLTDLESGDAGQGVLLEAHVDTLGAMVSEIKGNGRLKVTPIGGMNANNAEGENCRIVTRFGGIYEGTCQLINASVHVNGDYDKTGRTFDTVEIVPDEPAADKEAVAALGISPGDYVFYPQLGVKLCSMAGGGVQKIYMVFLREPSRRDRSGSDLFHLWDGFEIKMNFDRNVSCFIFVNALMHDDFFD